MNRKLRETTDILLFYFNLPKYVSEVTSNTVKTLIVS